MLESRQKVAQSWVWWHIPAIPELQGLGKEDQSVQPASVVDGDTRRNNKEGSGEIVWQLRALAFLPEDLGSIPTTHVTPHKCL